MLHCLLHVAHVAHFTLLHICNIVVSRLHPARSRNLAENIRSHVCSVPYGNSPESPTPKTKLRCSLQIPSAATTGIRNQIRFCSRLVASVSHRVQKGSVSSFQKDVSKSGLPNLGFNRIQAFPLQKSTPFGGQTLQDYQTHLLARLILNPRIRSS